MKKFDEGAARRAFDLAIREQQPEFEKFFLARLCGLDFSYPEDTCVIHFPVEDFMQNPQGSLHGGIIAMVLDISMGHLLRRTLGSPGTTIEMKTQYFAPVRAPHARACAKFLHRGRSICFLESQLFDATDTLAASATATWRVLRTEGASA